MLPDPSDTIAGPRGQGRGQSDSIRRKADFISGAGAVTGRMTGDVAGMEGSLGNICHISTSRVVAYASTLPKAWAPEAGGVGPLHRA